MMVATELIAVLADIHGNLDALEAVLEDAGRAGARTFIDLGDCVAGPLDPRRTAERLMALGATTILGNHDRDVLSADPGPSAAFARERLDPEQLAWLAALPPTANLDGGLLACHGSPLDDTCYLLETVTEAGEHPRDPAEVRLLLGDVGAELVLCGHTHLLRLLPLADGPTVVNPGSVGLPAYDHDIPFAHVMESGSPQARYALLKRGGGREDWAVALETGLTGRSP
jgi:predicted phosphodiesterase